MLELVKYDLQGGRKLSACYADGICHVQRDVMEDLIEALQKQIPKRPDFEADGYSPDGFLVYDTWICPSCGKRYEVDYDDYKHCPECGQAIDWQEEHNEGDEDQNG